MQRLSILRMDSVSTVQDVAVLLVSHLGEMVEVAVTERDGCDARIQLTRGQSIELARVLGATLQK